MYYGSGNKIFDVLSVLFVVIFIIGIIVLAICWVDFAILIGIAVAIFVGVILFFNGFAVIFDWIACNIDF